MAGFDQFISNLSPESHIRGKQFEVFVKWFLSNDPEWSANVEKVWLWDEWPERWGPDCGIDLVFAHSDGSTWAVQAKCYDSKYQITKKDVDTFLSESNRPIINHRLLISSTDLINSKAARTCADQEKPVTIFKLQDFQQSPIDYPDNFESLFKAKVKDQPQPRPHQREAIDAVVAGLKEHDRGQLIMACGTGKTFTTLWIKEALKPNLALVLLPSLSLLSQTMREWAWGGRDKFKILNICSDTSVGKKTEDMSVSEAPYPVTSDPEEIKRFMLSGEDRIIFCTYHSSPLIAEVQSDAAVPDFDLIIGDEAHRCAGKADSAFTTVLDGNAIRSHKRLFTTATPRMYGNSVKAAAQERGTEVYGMDDVAAFGPELHRLSFGQAIEQDLLTDYQVVVIGVTEPMVKVWIEEQILLQTSSDLVMDARSLAAKVGVLKAIKDYGLERIISFHSKVASAKQFAKEINELLEFIPGSQKPNGTIWSDYVSGTMSAADRKLRIDRLKALSDHDIGVLTNARCLSEGVDVPSLDGVAFVDPRGSQVDIIQAVGRAIRRSDNKEKGTIVIPVFIDESDMVEDVMESSVYEPIWNVIKALRSHDESLGETIDHYRQQLGHKGSQIDIGFDGKIIMDLPMSVPKAFGESLRTVLVEKTSSSWEFYFGQLERYIETEGHTLVPGSFVTDDGYRLGGWVNRQRGAMQTLNPELKARLDSIGFVWNQLDDYWEQGFKALTAFYQKFGHFSVTRGIDKYTGFGLNSWISTQRLAFKKNKLSSDRKQRLDALGFVWDANTEAWEEGFRELSAFYDEHGHCKVPANHRTDTGLNLGKWLDHQRSAYKRGALTANRQDRMSALDVIWDVQKEQWETSFSQLVEYSQEHGDCNPPDSYLTHAGFALGKWVGKQRTASNKGRLSQERKQRLDALGFVWDVRAAKWEEGFNELMAYYHEHGDSMAPAKYMTPTGFKLGNWIYQQRTDFKQNKLAPERKQRLDDIEFVWAVRDRN